MSSPRHTFIPLEPQDLLKDVEEQLASQTPTQKRGLLYTYDLPSSCRKVFDAVVKPMADDMKKWAESQQKGFNINDFERPRYQPQFYPLKKEGDTVWTDNGYVCLIVPFFKGTMEVLVRILGSSDEYSIKWESGSVLHLDEATGILPLQGDLIFYYSLFYVSATGAVAITSQETQSSRRIEG
ncbi:hypothetical protein B0T26DRAFT_719103 [Lasiosphaeria miniovina]|uniref:Uncharacterized protein n=1 Tax=Lasiosphaeria miniovina TaxID=1954250 RepID=A0AA40ADP6_9PEZI|nr:uncharacterized protein B0T26DRAFT_719103 [Lasiosphaeria miniovina]KAK0713951.1 hypothetical protein B0T26DRAFT_719103 [Lasiosphaeria miniovina]